MKKKTKLAERRAALLQAGAQVSHKVTSILDPNELLKQTVDIICDEFGFYYAGVFLMDEKGENAVLKAGRGKAGAAMVTEGHKLKVDGHSMIGSATGRRKALIALDVGEEPVHFKNPHLPNTRSEMALPLMVGDQVIGALTVQSKDEAAFSDDDITALQSMADQLAIAIDNAQLHAQRQDLLAQAERRARLLDAASQVGRDVSSILDMEELMSRTVDIICEAYEFYYAGVFLIDAAGEWAVLQTGRGEAGATMVNEGHKLKVGGHSMIGAVCEQHKARIALDVGEEPVHFKNPHLPDTRSEMGLPLIVGDEIIGALTVQSVQEAAFSDEDIAALQAMADQLAIAIHNARLLKDLEAAHAELVRTKTYEVVASAVINAIHWIGNKALPISTSAQRLREDLEQLAEISPVVVDSMREDLDLIEQGAQVIISVQEHMIGPSRDELPRPAMLEDVAKDTVVAMNIPSEIIQFASGPDLPLGLVDTTQLGRALSYVLKNALEAVDEVAEKHIEVGVNLTPDNRFINISIADSGPGIPEEAMHKIWSAFYTTKGAKHAGLGLSAAQQILKEMDGEVSATNREEGGTLFELLIPVFDGPASPARLPSEKSILIIDDDDAWSRFAEQALTDAGNSVTRSADGQANPAEYDLVLLDDVLETSDCEALLKWLRTLESTAKTLIVVSSLRVDRMMQLLQFGVQDVVLKPYTAESLGEMFDAL